MHGRKGYSLVSIKKRVIVRQRFHKRRSFFNHAVVIAGLGPEHRGLEQAVVSNAIDPTVLINQQLVDCENFGDGEVDTIGQSAYFASS